MLVEVMKNTALSRKLCVNETVLYIHFIANIKNVGNLFCIMLMLWTFYWHKTVEETGVVFM